MANADLSGDTRAFQDGDGPRFPGFLNWLGAILAVAVVAALGSWGYHISARDVTEVPIVRAAQGPMRVAPEDPGGELAEHQGLAVNLVAAGGGVRAPAERLVLAPGPTDLKTEDLPLPQLTPETSEGQSQPSTVDSPESPGQFDVVDSQLMSQDSPATEPLFLEANLPLDESVPTEDAVLTLGAGVVRSPLPRPRPDGDLAAQSIALSVARSVEEQSVEVDSSSIPAGTPLAQFGAYDSPEIARSEWTRLRERFPDFLHGRNWFVEETVSGGRSYFRLRTTGFDSLNDSKRFCSLFTAEEQDCIVVEMRR